MLELDEIKAHFNSKKRVEHDLLNYSFKSESDIALSSEMDFFEKPRQNHIVNEICKINAKNSSILDVGCGVGSLILNLLEKGYDARGIDIAENMVHTAKDNLKKFGYEPEIELKDIFEYFSAKLFDVITLNGVIWYYQDKLKFLIKIHSLLKNNGYVFVIHRNDLFNMFALNNGTIDFFTKHLFDQEMIDQGQLKNLINYEIPGLMNPIKNNGTLDKPYDNPLNIEALYNNAGFEIIDISYTYIHPAPPRFNLKFKEPIYHILQEKYGKCWQGMFLGSQFLVVAKKR